MRIILLYTIMACSLLAACQNTNSPNDSSDEKSEEKKNISKRNYSITKADSYSDLFFDSTAMEKFIANKKFDNKIANRLRSFYNARNYQFAWFFNEG